jgi:hypothetical protein
MSSIAAIGAAGGNPLGDVNQSSVYRDADFMAIMLAEITQQDPMNPSETSELVKGMQQLQQLANSRYEKYRDDVSWGQNLMGQRVVAGQVSMGDAEYEAHVERGLAPDRGYGTVFGEVQFFRTVGESVWVRIGEKDYPIDNVQAVEPAAPQESYYTGIADQLLGRRVSFLDDEGEQQAGMVDELTWNEEGEVALLIGGHLVPFERIRSISGT